MKENEGIENAAVPEETESAAVAESGNSAEENGEPLYYLNPLHEGQENVRISYTKEGSTVEDDQFEAADVEELFSDYNTQFYADTPRADEVWAEEENGTSYAIQQGVGNLRIRAVELGDGTPDTNPVYGVQSEEPTERLEADTAAVVADETTQYRLNRTTVEAPKAGIGLLFDDIYDKDNGQDQREKTLIECSDNKIGPAASNVTRYHQAKYLDLVDQNNGNAWVKASEDVTVYWPKPANAPKDAEFTLLHFEGLHREISIEEVEGMVGNCTVTSIPLTYSEDGEYLTFTVKPGGFSPFVLAWQEPDEPDEPDIPPYIPPVTPPVTPPEPEYKPEWLNTEDHYAYIIGYEDGSVRPNGSITRAEVATIFFRLLTDEARDEFSTDANSYTDVGSSDWFNTAVSTLSRMGILGGYEDGTFRPNSGITRAEFAKIAVSFFEYEGIEAENVFTDVAHGSWYEDFVAAAAEIGLIEGYEDGSFRPESGITRAEACTIINRTLGRAPDKGHLLPESEMLTWPDNPESAWYYAQMQEATNSHEYKWLGAIEQWTAKLPERDWTA